MSNYKFSKISGITITELLLDLALSTVVIASVFSLYINYRKINNIQSDTIFLFNNAINAYNFIKNDIKNAGYYGCNSDPTTIEYTITPGVDYTLSNIISAYEANSTGFNSNFNLNTIAAGWSPALNGQESSLIPDNGSDVLTVRFADPIPVALTSSDTTGTTISATGIDGKVATGDKLLISDCIRTVVFQAQTVSTNSITPNASVGAINAGAGIHKINLHTYYVKTNNNIASLYRLNNGVTELLVPYIENLQFIYGQDTNGDKITDIFRTGNNINYAYPITSVNIGILMRSANKFYNIPINYTFSLLAAPALLNETVTVTANSDNYLRRSFDFNVFMPNRL
jgi:type IV pilus assembly protein PilW